MHLVCFGMPRVVQEQIGQKMREFGIPVQLGHPCTLLLPVLAEVAMLYDNSVWRIRDELRHIELVCIRQRKYCSIQLMMR